MSNKLNALLGILKKYGTVAVAFSGGVDSSFLAATALQSCGHGAVAVTVASEFQAKRDIDHACCMAKEISIRHVVLKTTVLKTPAIVQNRKDRCYHCKKKLFSRLNQWAASNGIHRVVHGVNLDDLNDYRPGFKAAREIGIKSPLVEAGFDKRAIRSFSKKMGLKTWNMPSQSCLATRISYDRPITKKNLRMTEKSEAFLFGLGFSSVRVRSHGETARIEVDPESLEKIVQKSVREAVAIRLKELGFLHITLDLEGYVSGSMNRGLTDEL